MPPKKQVRACPYCGETQVPLNKEPVKPVKDEDLPRFHRCTVTGDYAPYVPVPPHGFKMKFERPPKGHKGKKDPVLVSYGFSKSGSPIVGGPR